MNGYKARFKYASSAFKFPNGIGINEGGVREVMATTNLSNIQRVYDSRINGNQLPSSCLLCLDGELNKFGHIIPALVLRWLKSASKKKDFFFNNSSEKVADTLAVKMLCDRCEEIFCTHEKYFTDKYFKKFYRNKSPEKIGDDIYFFSLSVAWRILVSTPMMKGEEDSGKYFSFLTESIRSYLLQPNEKTEVDVYVFHASDIVENLPEKHYNLNLLKYSVRQGIFAQRLMAVRNGSRFLLTPAPVPLVHFKLGVYYFLVACQDYLQSLTFLSNIERSDRGGVYVLKYSDELIGFLNYISNDRNFEVHKLRTLKNIEYNIISPGFRKMY